MNEDTRMIHCSCGKLEYISRMVWYKDRLWCRECTYIRWEANINSLENKNKFDKINSKDVI